MGQKGLSWCQWKTSAAAWVFDEHLLEVEPDRVAARRLRRQTREARLEREGAELFVVAVEPAGHAGGRTHPVAVPSLQLVVDGSDGAGHQIRWKRPGNVYDSVAAAERLDLVPRSGVCGASTPPPCRRFLRILSFVDIV